MGKSPRNRSTGPGVVAVEGRPRQGRHSATRLVRAWGRLVALVLLASIPGSVPSSASAGAEGPADQPGGPARRPLALRMGTRHAEPSNSPPATPTIRDVPLPEVPSGCAIWASTGRDDDGNVYFGVSCKGDRQLSAALLRLDPRSGPVVKVGDVLGNLKRVGLGRPGQSQNKIHSKICTADDGLLYFTSEDEQGEKSDGSTLPTWGSHLWRMRPPDGKWEHLMAAPEGLIALGTAGRFVYALGYFDHVVYQYDTRDGATKSVRVGSAGGHISRGLLVDQNEHIYVPRVVKVSRPVAADPAVNKVGDAYLRSSLVEFDDGLREVQSVPLSYYEPTLDDASHGVVGFAALRDGGLVFTTHSGVLWRITPHRAGAAEIRRLGWFNPDGRSYSPCLYCPTGERFISGLSQLPSGEYEWIVHDLEARKSTVVELDRTSRGLLKRPGILVYGSNTLDDAGNAYLAGWVPGQGGYLPHALRVQWPAATGVASGDAAASSPTPRYSFLADDGPGDPGKPRDDPEAHRAAFREVVRVTADSPNGAAPRLSESRRQAIWIERPARVGLPDGSRKAAAVRRYQKVIQESDARPSPAGTPLLEGVDLWVRPRAAGPPEVISLTEKRRLGWEEYRFMAMHVSASDLDGLLPEVPVRVGETWEVGRPATLALAGGPGKLRGSLGGVQAGGGGKNVAVILVTGRVATALGDSDVSSRIELTFDPPAPGGSASTVDARGVISSMSLAQEDRRVPVGPGPGLKQDVRREVTYRREPVVAGPVPTAPRELPAATRENSWLAFADPQGRFEVGFPQEFVPGPSAGKTSADSFVIQRPRPDAVEVIRFTLIPVARNNPDGFLNQMKARWAEARIEALTTSLPVALPVAEWLGWKVTRVEATLRQLGLPNGRAARLGFFGYTIQPGGELGLAVEATTSRDPASTFREEVESILKGVRFGPSTAVGKTKGIR